MGPSPAMRGYRGTSVPLGQEHLLRAIALEYRELGKLAADGRME